MGMARLIQFGATKLGIMALVGFLVFQGYLLIRPIPVPLDPVRAQTADRVTTQIVEALSEQANTAWSTKYVKVARLQGDHGDHIRRRIEAQLPVRTNCRLVTDSMLAELRDTLVAKMARLGVVKPATADRWRIKPVTDLGGAMALSETAGVDYVVYGVVEDFRALDKQAYAKVAIALADAATGETVLEQRFEAGDEQVFADIGPAVMVGDATRAGWRFVGWLLFVLLLPVCTGTFWTQLLERESNFTNAVSLLFLTLVSTLLAWALMGFWMPTVWSWLTLGLAFMLAANWNLVVLNVIEGNRLEHAFR